MGGRFTDEQVDEMYREAPLKNGMLDYAEFTRIFTELWVFFLKKNFKLISRVFITIFFAKSFLQIMRIICSDMYKSKCS